MFRSIARASLLSGAAVAVLLPLAAAKATDADAAPDTGEIVVTGDKPVTVASAGTKTDTPIVETPQSISVVDASDIARLGLQNLDQALRFVAGVTPDTRGSSAEVYDLFKLRGFDAPVYLDGLKLFASGSGYAVPQVDISRLDRIEVIKGPSSALYGQSGPGGLVVENSKLPIDRSFYGAVSGSYGNYDFYRADADIGGAISPTVLWRVYGSANGGHDQQTYGRRERQTGSAAVTLGAGTSTSFMLLANYSHDPRNGDYGVFPALGTLVANPAGKIPTHFYGGEPGDFFGRNQLGLTYVFRHDFGGGWTFKSSARYQYIKSHLGIVYTAGTQSDFYSATPSAAPTNYSRYSYSTIEHDNAWTYDNQLTGKIDTGPLHHELLFGVDRQVAHSNELYAFGGATGIDVFDPVYGTMPTPRTPDTVPGYAGGLAGAATLETQVRQQGVYAQDQISAGDLRVTLSGRQDWARTSNSSGVRNDQKFTWRAGALYLTPIGLAPYASYSTSFEPQASLLASGELAKPSLGKQIEAGLKYQVPNTPILITAAWFHIDQTNVLSSNPITFLSTQTGKVRSQGVEIEAKAPLPHGFSATVAFSRQSVKDVKDGEAPYKIGYGLVTVGRGGTTAELDWSPKSRPAAGLLIGGIVRHVDSVYADFYQTPADAAAGPPGTPMRTPAYTVFDALAHYDLAGLDPRLKGVSVALNLKNVLDKKYLTSCYANYGWCFYGDRRTVQGTIGFSW
jgi:iron complex outermembrane receptor protein